MHVLKHVCSLKYQYYQLQNNIACLTFSLARSKLVTHQRREQDDNNHTDLEQCTSFNGGVNLSIARAHVSYVVNGINVNCGNLDVY